MKDLDTFQKVSAALLTSLLLMSFVLNPNFTKIRADEPVTPVTPPIVIAPTLPSSNGNSGNSAGSTNTTGTPVCTNAKPAAPQLFQVNTTRNSATLYFSPAAGNTTYYMVAYGFAMLDDRFGSIYSVQNSNHGVQSIRLNHLATNKTYYLRVRGGDGCMPGDWSNTLKVTTNGKTYFLYN